MIRSAAFLWVVSGKFLQELVLTGRLAAGDRTPVSRSQDACQPETGRLSAGDSCPVSTSSFMLHGQKWSILPFYFIKTDR
ncbi:MAG: hypothetical protein LBS54_05440 [Dysgonamonadaceae bacterium]|nr:hypothetical protein [Dysgonamonadaceae bacterium]